MELKSKLEYPYSEMERMNFIVQQNHTNGYEIRNVEREIEETIVDPETGDETTTTRTVIDLEAWGKTTAELFTIAKQAKHAENSSKGEMARETQAFTVTFGTTELAFDTSRTTQQDIQTAMAFLGSGAESYEWFDNNGTRFVFTSTAQLIQVSTLFMQKANIYPKWSYFKAQIDACTTIEELNAITIDYGINLEEQN